MTSITLTVAGAKATATVTGPLTSGMAGIPVTIEYDDAWKGMTKNLVCKCGRWGPEHGEARIVLNIEECATVPQEVMQPDMSLYLGVEGYSADGMLILPTVWADCGRILYGANADGDPSAAPKLSVWNQLQAEIREIRESSGTHGWNEDAQELLINILRNGVYTTDQSGTITALAEVIKAAPDVDEEEPEVVTFSVSNSLSNLTTSNSALSIGRDEAYIAVLMVEEGYLLKTITVTMGGVDITDTVWDSEMSTITVPAVTGNLVIIAAAVLPQIETLEIVRVTTYPDITTFAYQEGQNSNNQYSVAKRSTMAGGVLSVDFDPAMASNFDMNLFVFGPDGAPYKHTYSSSGNANGGLYEPTYADPGSGNGFFK